MPRRPKPKAALVEVAPGFYADPREVRKVAARAKKKREAPDWFGCGKTITQDSWNRFLAAQNEYYRQQDKP